MSGPIIEVEDDLERCTAIKRHAERMRLLASLEAPGARPIKHPLASIAGLSQRLTVLNEDIHLEKGSTHSMVRFLSQAKLRLRRVV